MHVERKVTLLSIPAVRTAPVIVTFLVCPLVFIDWWQYTEYTEGTEGGLRHVQV